MRKDGKPLTGEKFRVVTKFDWHDIGHADFVGNGKPAIVKAKPTRPGWLYFGVEMLDEKGSPRQGPGITRFERKPAIVDEIGAIFDADRLGPAGERPADFDAFWAACRAKLDTVPVKTLPKWSGKDLIVQGGSGGGMQATVAAALDPRVTPAQINVPSFCDFDGFKVGRLSSTYCYRTDKRLERIKGDPRTGHGGTTVNTAALKRMARFANEITVEHSERINTTPKGL